MCINAIQTLTDNKKCITMLFWNVKNIVSTICNFTIPSTDTALIGKYTSYYAPAVQLMLSMFMRICSNLLKYNYELHKGK